MEQPDFMFAHQTRAPICNVVNVVSCANLGCKLNLKHIAMKARNAEWNPKRFNAVIMRIKEPKSTALIFMTGKMVVTGAKTEPDSRIACRKFARILQKVGLTVPRLEISVQNIVGTVKLPFGINLTMLSAVHHRHGRWEPEIFPAMVYKVIEPKVTLLIFSSGKVVFLGAKKRADLDIACNIVYPVLAEFKNCPP